MAAIKPAMGILGREEILFEIARGSLVTRCEDPANRTRGCSYDLTVGTIFWDDKVIRREDGQTQVVVPPGGVVGLFTAEDIALPDDVCATAFAINDMSSRGFLVLNPGHIDPGFSGALTIKALNVRKTSIAISHGDPIFTVIFQRLDRATIAYSGNSSREDRERKFNAETVQSSPRTVASMIELDRDGPFPGREEVKDLIGNRVIERHDIIQMIRSDAINRAMLLLALIAAIASILAVVIAMSSRPISPTTNSGSSIHQQSRSDARADSLALPAITPLESDNILVRLGACANLRGRN